MNALIPLSAAVLAALMPAIAAAQDAAPAPAETERVKQVIVYGRDPCPASTTDEITVCARMPDADRYRIPKGLRTDPNDPRVQSWANRAEAIEYVGRSGIDSCSPVGAGGATGCFAQIARAAKAERKALMGDASWADLVAEERAKRLSRIDADSAAIEAQAQADEADDARARTPQAAGGAARPVSEAGQ